MRIWFYLLVRLIEKNQKEIVFYFILYYTFLFLSFVGFFFLLFYGYPYFIFISFLIIFVMNFVDIFTKNLYKTPLVHWDNLDLMACCTYYNFYIHFQIQILPNDQKYQVWCIMSVIFCIFISCIYVTFFYINKCYSDMY